MRLGVFVEWLADGYTDPILDEIVAAAKEQDIDVVCFVNGLNHDDYPEPKRHRPFVYADPDNIDAILLVSLGNTLPASAIEAYFERFEPMPIASVAVHWEKYPRVVVDNQTGVRLGVRHLIRAHKRKRIACIRGPEVSSEADERFLAYRETLAEHSIPFDPELVTIGQYYKPHGADAVRLWLDERKLLIDAIVTANDAMALGALEEIERRGLRVPEDISLLGFDDIEAARYWRPPLTTVRQPVREHARKAFEVVMAQMAGKAVPLQTTVKSQLVLRRSCGCIASAGRAMSSFPPEHLDSANVSTSHWARHFVGALLSFAQAVPTASTVTNEHESLIEALAGDRVPFLRWLENLLDQAIQRHIDILGAFGVLNDMRRSGRRQLAAGDYDRIEALLSDADMVIAEVAERSQAVRHYRSEELFTNLVRTNEALVTAVDLPTLQSVLSANLDRFGIKSCYLCIYEMEHGCIPSPWARLILACNTEAHVEVPEEGLRFRARDILPNELFDREHQTNWLICPLLRRENNFPGYTVIERGVAEGFVYDGLIDQIGSAYQRIELLNRVVREAQLREVAERERLEKEMQIATNIQTGILPRDTQVDGLEISAIMYPASEVGGDYYDIIAIEGGCWIGIGDVAGHGLLTGLVMLMLQSVVGGLVRNRPLAGPKDILPAINSLLYDNIRRRMGQDEHVTLTLIRHDREGHLRFAGAHEDILICRAQDGSVECLHTPGVWTAAIPDIGLVTEESQCEMFEGDVLLLYTDGITEAMNHDREMFGLNRLAAALARHRKKPVGALRDAIISDVRRWMAVQADDITLLVAKQSRNAVRLSINPR